MPLNEPGESCQGNRPCIDLISPESASKSSQNDIRGALRYFLLRGGADTHAEQVFFIAGKGSIHGLWFWWLYPFPLSPHHVEVFRGLLNFRNNII